ncbi:SHOCT domain-containing protein [Streptomyces megasporus]|uniref:SHOCT domain-containing protein n=1 Tax=Streptomyces megasporus TaxID=44060 RepID=UPI0004E2493D|nr:SHOCT domain-containing protein [Streptomyces megasporus]
MSDRLPLAYDYPVLGAFWTVMWVFLWIMWLVLLFRIVTDVFRDRSMSGWAKAAWLLFLILVPFVGVLVYVIARGRDMGRREARHAQEQREAVDAYIRQAAAGSGPGSGEVEQLTRLSDLKARGDISEAEFERAKEKILH